MRCKGASTQYGCPQVAGLQKFAKFPAGESVTPRGGCTQQTVILTSLTRREIDPGNQHITKQLIVQHNIFPTDKT